MTLFWYLENLMNIEIVVQRHMPFSEAASPTITVESSAEKVQLQKLRE
jgi:hypothetical protein